MEPIQVPKIGTCILKCFCGSRISIINKILFFKNVNESLLFCIWSRYGTLQGHFGIGMKAVITQTSTHDELTCIYFPRISLPTMQTTNSCVYLQHLMKNKLWLTQCNNAFGFDEVMLDSWNMIFIWYGTQCMWSMHCFSPINSERACDMWHVDLFFQLEVHTWCRSLHRWQTDPGKKNAC